MEIYISPKKICTQFECGTRIQDFPLSIKNESTLNFLSDEKVPQDISEVTFLRKRWYGWSKVVMPEKYLSAVISFLQMFHNEPRQDFDCYSFATLAAGLPLHDKEWLHAFWNFRKINRWQVRGPKIIFLVNEGSQSFSHAALHIGGRQMLSVQGAGGTLSVSTLSDLQKAYAHSPDLWEVTPKSEEEVRESIAMIAHKETKNC